MADPPDHVFISCCCYITQEKKGETPADKLRRNLPGHCSDVLNPLEEKKVSLFPPEIFIHPFFFVMIRIETLQDYATGFEADGESQRNNAIRQEKYKLRRRKAMN